jgi:hypothetical protein
LVGGNERLCSKTLVQIPRKNDRLSYAWRSSARRGTEVDAPHARLLRIIRCKKRMLFTTSQK